MRKLDITEKLSFNEKPVLVIKEKEIEVDDSAPVVLKIMGMMGDDPTTDDIIEAYELLFDAKARKVIDGMKLNFKSLATVIRSAITLITDDGEPEGE